MNVVTMKFSIDIDNDDQVKYANEFIQNLKKCTDKKSAVVEAPVSTVRSKEETKPEAVKAAPVTQAPAAQATAVEGDSKKQDEIRKIMAPKLANNREAIKAKLTELGASSFSEMAVDKYVEFEEFLLGLPD